MAYRRSRRSKRSYKKRSMRKRNYYLVARGGVRL